MKYIFNSPEYSPHFSGHESFHMRYGWLKKAYDEVAVAKTEGRDTLKVFTDDDAISRFGVGKNMVASIRYWATSCNVLSGESGKIDVGEIGERLFGVSCLDPYLENPSSLWLLHWKLASNMDKTSYHWMFNYFNEPSFNKRILEQKIHNYANQSGWKKLNKTTVEKDLAVLLNTYSMGALHKKGSHEDSLTSPLAELGLIRRGLSDGRIHLGWGAKPSLSKGIFLYSLLEFWAIHPNINTLNFQTILLEPRSPGRIFLMDENELSIRLMQLEEMTKGRLTWSETAGMRQVVKKGTITFSEVWDYIADDICPAQKKVA